MKKLAVLLLAASFVVGAKPKSPASPHPPAPAPAPEKAKKAKTHKHRGALRLAGHGAKESGKAVKHVLY